MTKSKPGKLQGLKGTKSVHARRNEIAIDSGLFPLAEFAIDAKQLIQRPLSVPGEVHKRRCFHEAEPTGSWPPFEKKSTVDSFLSR